MTPRHWAWARLAAVVAGVATGCWLGGSPLAASAVVLLGVLALVALACAASIRRNMY